MANYSRRLFQPDPSAVKRPRFAETPKLLIPKGKNNPPTLQFISRISAYWSHAGTQNLFPITSRLIAV